MGDREGAGQRVLRRRKARTTGRARSSRSATRSSRSSRSRARRRASSTEMREHFDGPARAARSSISSRPSSSTRSAPARIVLGAVDTVFCPPHAHAGLTADPVPPVHEALPRGGAGPGRNLGHWRRPTSATTIEPGMRRSTSRTSASGDGEARQAHRRHRSRRGGARAGSPRTCSFWCGGAARCSRAIIRALKNEGIPVAGADRLVLTEHIAVMDLMVLADALLLPEDDLALATRAEEPAVRARRRRAVQARLGSQGQPARRRCARSGPISRRGSTRMREQARALTPFAFYADLLGAGGGRKQIPGAARPRGQRRARRIPQSRARLRARRDAVAARLRRLAARRAGRGEARHGNGARRGAGDDGARRQGPGGADRHPRRHHDAAAGLASAEAAVAAGDKAAPDTPARLVWAGAKANDVGPMGAARETALDEARDEYRRLLYVAMTRAIERLIVCGVEGKNKPPEGCWYDLVAARSNEHCVAGTSRRRRRRSAALSQDAGRRGECRSIRRARRRRRSRFPAG